jgi:hypothetical protein
MKKLITITALLCAVSAPAMAGYQPAYVNKYGNEAANQALNDALNTMQNGTNNYSNGYRAPTTIHAPNGSIWTANTFDRGNGETHTFYKGPNGASFSQDCINGNCYIN